MAVQAWLMQENGEDQRLPHHKNPPEYVSMEELEKLGVLYWHLDPEKYENDPDLQKIRDARGYSYMDLLDLCPEKVENYEQKLKNFYTEHIHADEEIRYCLEGSGYFDVRDKDDRWIRILIKAGDLIVLPAGIYHRFTLDTCNYIKLMRLFVGEPVWTPFNRPQEHHPARKEYIENFSEKTGQLWGTSVNLHKLLKLPDRSIVGDKEIGDVAVPINELFQNVNSSPGEVKVVAYKVKPKFEEKGIKMGRKMSEVKLKYQTPANEFLELQKETLDSICVALPCGFGF